MLVTYDADDGTIEVDAGMLPDLFRDAILEKIFEHMNDEEEE